MIDAIYVKIRDGQVANQPVYVVLAVICDGLREILGLWVGDGGEGAKFWGQVCADLKNRGVGDICVLLCEGLKDGNIVLTQRDAEPYDPAKVDRLMLLHLEARTGYRVDLAGRTAENLDTWDMPAEA